MRTIHEHIAVFRCLLLAIALCISTAGLGQDRFHFIFIGKTDDPDIGRAISADAILADSLFRYIEEEADINLLSTHFLTGKEYSAERVTKFVDTLTLGARDKVLMIIDNHGARFADQYSRFPMVELPVRKQNKNRNMHYLSLKGIHDAMVQKGAQLVLTIGIMCNTYQEVRPGSRRAKRIEQILKTDNPTKPLIKTNQSHQTRYDSILSLQKLFHFGKGQVLFNAADRNQRTYYNDLSQNNRFGSLALHSIFDEFTRLKDERNQSDPTSIASRLLVNIKNGYETTLSGYKLGTRRDQNNQLVTTSNVIYKAHINQVSFDHTDSIIGPAPVVIDSSCMTASSIQQLVTQKAKNTVIQLMRYLNLDQQGIRSNKQDFRDQFRRTNGQTAYVQLVKGISDPSTKTVTVEQYYDDYVVLDQSAADANKQIEVRLKPGKSPTVSSIYLSNGGLNNPTGSQVERYEVEVDFTQEYITLSKSGNCVSYADETYKTATVYVYFDKATCTMDAEAQIEGIRTSDGFILALKSPYIINGKSYSKCQ